MISDYGKMYRFNSMCIVVVEVPEDDQNERGGGGGGSAVSTSRWMENQPPV